MPAVRPLWRARPALPLRLRAVQTEVGSPDCAGASPIRSGRAGHARRSSAAAGAARPTRSRHTYAARRGRIGFTTSAAVRPNTDFRTAARAAQFPCRRVDAATIGRRRPQRRLIDKFYYLRHSTPATAAGDAGRDPETLHISWILTLAPVIRPVRAIGSVLIYSKNQGFVGKTPIDSDLSAFLNSAPV